MDLGLSGRTALICGSSSGIGKAIATVLAAEGARVVLNGRRPEGVAKAAEDVGRVATLPVLTEVADVSDAGEACAMVRRVERDPGTGGLDILICNAGGPPPGRTEDLPADAWRAALELNLLSTIHLCRAAIEPMKRRRWGRLLCLTSIAAKQPIPGLILSSTARAGVLGFAKSLADEVADSGVTVNVLCPGYIGTERLMSLAHERAQATGRSAEAVLADMARAAPVGRVGDPEELASVAAFLVSEPARYVTGTALSVDGGLTRSIM